MATNNPPGTPPYEEGPPMRREGFDSPGAFLHRAPDAGIPREGSGYTVDSMDPLQIQANPSPPPTPSPHSLPVPPAPGPVAGGVPSVQEIVSGQRQAGSPARQGGGLSLQAPSFTRAFSANEFYPGQERPWESRASGGDFMAVASSGRLPWGVIADRMTDIAEKKKALEDGMKKLFGGADFEGHAAEPYERAYQQYVSKDMNEYVDGWAKAYHGGDRNAAMKDIYANPESNRQYQAHLRDLKAVGDTNKYKYEEYEKLYTDVNDNKAWVSPETKAELEKFLTVDPYNSGQTTAQLASTYKRLDHQVSRDKLWNETYLPRIKEEFDTLQQQGKVVQLPGGSFRFLEQTQTRTLDRMKEQAVNDMVDKYGVGSKEEIERFVDANTPEYSVTKDDQLSVPTPRASANGKRSGWNNGGYDTGTGIRAVPDNSGNAVRRVNGKVIDIKGDSIRLYRDVDGEQVDLKPQEFKDEEGKWVFMKPSRLVKDPAGDWFIEGTVYARPRERAVGTGSGGGDTPTMADVQQALAAADGESAPVAQEEANTELIPLRTQLVPLSRNNEFRSNYVDPDKVMAEWRNGNGGVQAVNTRPATTAPAPVVDDEPLY